MAEPNLFSADPQMSALSLSQLMGRISNRIHSSSELMRVWVRAELSDLRVVGGHCYMEILEKNAAGAIVAKARATIWASTFQFLRKKFYTETGRDLQTGMKVLLQGNTAHHAVYGLSVNITDIDPSFTLGDIERNRRLILEKLYKEGVLEMNKKLEMPMLPQRIAVISAEGAAGYGDFMNQLKHNEYGFKFQTELFQASMQGDRVRESVEEAFNKISRRLNEFDCVAIIRGGGATTDLVSFDDYAVAFRLATFPLPVVVGIGHERDRTVLDEIANVREKTPTAVAAYFIARAHAAYERATTAVDFIRRQVLNMLAGEQRRITQLSTSLPALVKANIAKAEGVINREIARIPVLASKSIEMAMQRLNTIQMEVQRSSFSVIEKQKMKIESLQNMVNVLSPLNILKRGYAVVRVGGKAVTSVEGVRESQQLEIELQDGKLMAEIKKKISGEG